MVILRVRRIGYGLITLVWLMTGCSDQKILEKVGFTQTTSYDLLPSGDLKVAISIPKADPDAQTKREVLTTTAKSSKQARIFLAQKTDLIVVSGQLRNVLFGMSIVKSGIWKHIDTLVRDPSISPQVKVTIVEGDAQALLLKDFKQHPRTGKYIDHLLEKEAKAQSIPKVTLYHFTRDYYDAGIDPVAPVIRDSGKDITIAGIGLFKGDKYIAKIDPEDSLIFAFLRGGFEQGELSIKPHNGDNSQETIMFSSLISNRKVRINNSQEDIQVDINVRVKGSVLEYFGNLKLSDYNDKKVLESRISAYISEEGEKMVRRMQQLGVDSLGIGIYVRNCMSYKQWKSMKWDEVYPRVKVNCNIRVEIKDIGKFK